ncbi:HAMP domain-containing sensor histidine kinase [Spirosoma terrae]|uniref:sensor histidine kinase n=1 Tax=Spirosoma terrae TaxID=1968276 RepID=UPI001BAF1CCB|nr:HAMP domain-containing sensor histidine kinase [Spirosoma terrae]
MISLFSQTARNLLLTALAIALIGSLGFYTLIHRTIRHEVDEILEAQISQTERQLQHQLPALLAGRNDNPRIMLTSEVVRPTFSDSTLIDSLNDQQPIPIRQLKKTVSVGNQLYLMTAQLPYYEFNELAREMSVGVILGFLILMGLSVTIGLSMSRRLWRPFHATVELLGDFRLDQPVNPVLPASRIREFSRLNHSLNELMQKLRRQFSLQKQFTENASHELQTPLAVATAELDLLMQSEQLTEQDHDHLQRATTAISRLSQLNRSLLLLTQVENDQFSDDAPLDISTLLQQYVGEYAPFFEHKQLTFRASIADGVWLRINRQLAGVLLTNLLKNAVRHGRAGGEVMVELTAATLVISNSGEVLPFPADTLFNRFVKDPARPDSTGLGLALVKQICDRYGLLLTYTYDVVTSRHSFRIDLVPQAV